ncbi:MAG TPA: UbiH/UbiF/VisC/COQ6 family ubiquinone biosynthesis hydroxylase [Gammaproteobacteria bacterium]|nr:UbiH/UbiF/VisC/COQ6 family ubiquinone biosynthesis hydroxylase [Gammaproteobacteria bacterium]
MGNSNNFDVVIVGGGVVGAALACALKDSSLSIALLDTQPAAAFDPKAEVDLRVFALSRASRRILESVGAWEAIAAARVSPYREMHVWDARGEGSIHFDSAELGEPELGYIVENRLLQHALWAELEDRPQVTLLAPAQPEALSITDEAVTLGVSGGRRLKARLVVAADGAGSKTRAMAGIETEDAPYGQRAVVAHVQTELPHRETAWQRFLPTGPLAFLPLKDGRVSIVWSADEAEAERILALDDAAFCAALTEASAARLGEVHGTTQRVAFPLQRLHAREYVRPRFALAGDAAHALHPLAGQGVNLGLLDAAALAEVISAAARRGRDIGDMGVLRRYERWRKGDNLSMIFALDGFKRLFSNGNAPLTRLRNAGLRAVDGFTPLKHAFMRRAMGLSGDLPDSAR